MNLDSAVFYSKNLSKVIDFYRDTIGLTIEYQQDDQYVSFLFENNVRLGIKKGMEKRELAGGQTAIVTMNNIEKFYKSLKRKTSKCIKSLQTKVGARHLVY